jgi:hypothetical protein
MSKPLKNPLKTPKAIIDRNRTYIYSEEELLEMDERELVDLLMIDRHCTYTESELGVMEKKLINLAKVDKWRIFTRRTYSNGI